MGISTVLFLLLIAIVHATIIPNVQDEDSVALDDNTIQTEFTTEDKMKEMRIKMVKLQIMAKLNLKETPPSIQRPSDASKEIIRRLMEEEEEWQEERERLISSEERLLIHAENCK